MLGLLGTHSEEVINLSATAIRLGLKADAIKIGIYTYPTNSCDITYMLWMWDYGIISFPLSFPLGSKIFFPIEFFVLDFSI